jgi:hypothetical protein
LHTLQGDVVAIVVITLDQLLLILGVFRHRPSLE